MTPQTTRIAPSPTGDMHLGTARTAYFNWLAARATGGRFILRIDDTDLARSNAAHVDVILATMDWLGLDADLVVKQSDRLDIYRDAADRLVDKGLAVLDGGALRLGASLGDDAWSDTIAGSIPVTGQDRKNMAGLVLVRSDGMPTYHFANCVDDIDLGVTWVIRGTDHISNTPKHIAIRHALSASGWRQAADAAWSHVGLITRKKKKLSKRDGAASMLLYRDAGTDPDALLNFMLRLGWGPSVDDKSAAVIDRDRAKALFIGGGRMRSSPADMDDALLASLDRKYKARKTAARA